MRKALVVLTLALAGLGVSTGCNGPQIVARDALLRQLRKDLSDDVGPKYFAYVDADKDKDPLVKKQDKALVTDMVAQIDAVAPPTTADATAASSTQ